MKVGDLVEYYHEAEHVNSDEIGIIVGQVGVVDRWLVYWFGSKYTAGYNGCILEVILRLEI